jgi:cytochrome c5
MNSEHRLPRHLSLIAGICALVLAACDSGQDKLSLSSDQRQATNERTKPVGQVTTGDVQKPGAAAATPPSTAEPATAAKAPSDPGKKAYDSVCTACHGAGVAGAPKVGDKAVWAERMKQGLETLYTHAIAGFQGKAGMMPAKGGGTALSNEDVKAAVRYMLAQSGVAGAEGASAKSGAEPQAAAAPASTPSGATPKGKALFEKSCAACHGAGLAGAPKLGDKSNWAPRIAQGVDVLVKHAITGFGGSAGIMPPKGGFSDLSDEDIRLTVEYMIDKSK